MNKNSNRALSELIKRLRKISNRGPINGADKGPSSVGITLLRELGIAYSSTSKPSFKGIVVSAARRQGKSNRVNLFAQVADWSISDCKSSREILERHGYMGKQGDKRLYCTVNAKRTNSQGLQLFVNNASSCLEEKHVTGSDTLPVVSWKLSLLRNRLMDSHPESLWVRASVHKDSQGDHFFYREATYTGRPRVGLLPELIEAGTITVDHLISNKCNRISEKGPLFKIDPTNLGLLFPDMRVFSLI